MKYTLAILAIAIPLSIGIDNSSSAIEYTVSYLDAMTGYRQINGLNNSGQCVGSLGNGSGLDDRAFVCDINTGILQEIGSLGGRSSLAFGINNLGQVAGLAEDATGQRSGYLWTPPGPMQSLGQISGYYCQPVAINNNGAILGVYSTWDSATRTATQRAALSQNGSPWQDVGFVMTATAMNDVGQIVGYSTSNFHACIWNGSGPLQDLGVLSGADSTPTAINNRGWVVGYAKTSSGIHAFLHNGTGTMQDLGTFGGTNSSAHDINESGQIVGWAETINGTPCAFLRDIDGSMRNLNDMIDPSSGWVLEQTEAINDNGQIVGSGRYNGYSRTYALTPVPPKSLTWNATVGNWNVQPANKPWTDGSGPAAFLRTDNIHAAFTNLADTSVSVDAAGVQPTTVDLTFGGGTHTFSGGKISGRLIKTGAGTAIFQSPNNFWTTSITGGIVETQASGGLGTGSIVLGNGATWRATSTQSSANPITLTAGQATVAIVGIQNQLTLSGKIDGTGGLTKSGPGIVELTGNNTFTGATRVDGGTLRGTTLSLPTAITLVNGGNVTFSETSGHTLLTAISGNGSFTKTGYNVLSIVAGISSLSYDGPTIIDAGTLRLNTPQPTTGSTVWWDASTLSLANGAAVTKVTDRSSMKYDGSPGDSSNPPTFNASALNGLGTIHFGGGTQGLVTSANLGITGNQSRSMFVVMARGSDKDMFIHLGGGGNYEGFGIDSKWNDPTPGAEHVIYCPYTVGSGGVTAPARATGVYEMYSASWNGTQASGAINGIPLTPGTPQTLSTVNGPLRVGYMSQWNMPAKGDMAEVLVYNRTLTDAERQNVEQYLWTKWFSPPVANLLPTTTDLTIRQYAYFDMNNISQTIRSLSGNGGVTIGTATLTVNGSVDSTFSGTLSGSGTFIKDGPSTLTLSSQDTTYFSGSMRVAGGRLRGTTRTLRTPISLANGSNVAFDMTYGDSFSNSISGDGSVTKTGTGVLTLNTPSSYIGATTISEGTLRLVTAGPANGALLRLDASTLNLADGAKVTYLYDQTDSWANKTGLPVGTPTFHANGLNGKGTVQINGPNQGLITASNLGISGNQARSLFVVMSHASDGDMIVHTGTGSNAFGIYNKWANPNPSPGEDLGILVPYLAGPGGVVGVYQPANTFQIYDATWTTNGDGTGYASGYINGTYIGRGSNQVLNSSDAPLQIGYVSQWGASSKGEVAEVIAYGRALTDAERLQTEAYLNQKWFLADYNILPSTTSVTVASGAVLDINGIRQMVGSLSGQGNVTLGAGSLTINGTESATFTGSISGNGGSLVKGGNSVITLGGTCTYTGPTTIIGGRLVVNGSLASPTVTVNAGASLGGSGSLAGKVTVAGGSSQSTQGAVSLVDGVIGTLTLSDPNASDTALTLGGMSAGTPSIMDFEVGGAADSILLSMARLMVNPGGATINISPLDDFHAGVYDLIDFGNGKATGLDRLTLGTTSLPGYTLSLQSTPTAEQLVVSAVPEPSTIALLAAGCIAMMASTWRRRRRSLG